MQIALGAPLPAGGKLRVTLLAGVDAPPGKRIDLSSRVTLQGTQATAVLSAADLLAGRNTLFAAVDANGDGRSENVASSTFTWSGAGLLAGACKRADHAARRREPHRARSYMAGFDNGRRACTRGRAGAARGELRVRSGARRPLGARLRRSPRAIPRSRS